MKNWQDDRNYRKNRQPDGTIKNLIFVDGQAVEVTDEVFAAYSQMDRQERYQEELLQDNPYVSLEKLADACVPIEEYMLEQAPSPEDICISMEDAAEQAVLLRLLPEALEQLTESERELIRALYFEGVPVREYARQKGVRLFVIQKRRDRILAKLKNIFENL